MRLRKIDESNLGDHVKLLDSDECFYLLEYTSGQSFTAGETNSLISNLKKSVDRAGRLEYQYKLCAIEQCSALLAGAINAKWLEAGTIVPIPPSKAKDDPLYDDRLLKVCRGIVANGNVDVREIVTQRESTRAAHGSEGNRLTVQELQAVYEIDERKCRPVPRSIAILDDVLTAGTHYRAMHNVLSARFPQAQIVGIFIARRVFPTAALFDLDGFI